MILSEEKRDLAGCIRLTIVCNNAWIVGGKTQIGTQIVAEVNLRGSDPKKLKPS